MRLGVGCLAVLVCGLALSGLIPVVQAEHGDDWPQFQYDAAHTGAVAAVPVDSYELQWQVNLDEAVQGAFGVGEDVLVVPGWSGALRAYDQSNGAIRWASKLGADGLGPPVIDHGVVFLASASGHAFAVGLDDGSVLWSSALGSFARAAPAVTSDVVVFATEAAGLLALDPASGAVVWRHPLPSTGSCPAVLGFIAPPTTSAGRVYWTSPDGVLVALHAATGAPLWTTFLRGELGLPVITWDCAFGAVTIAGGTAVVHTFLGYVHGFDLFTGAPLWTMLVDGYTLAHPTTDGKRVYVSTRADPRLVALDVVSGEVVWEHRNDNEWLANTGMVLVGDRVIAPLHSGRLLVLDARDGVLIETVDLPANAAVQVSPAQHEDLLFVGNDGGILAAYGPIHDATERPSTAPLPLLVLVGLALAARLLRQPWREA